MSLKIQLVLERCTLFQLHNNITTSRNGLVYKNNKKKSNNQVNEQTTDITDIKNYNKFKIQLIQLIYNVLPKNTNNRVELCNVFFCKISLQNKKDGPLLFRIHHSMLHSPCPLL